MVAILVRAGAAEVLQGVLLVTQQQVGEHGEEPGEDEPGGTFTGPAGTFRQRTELTKPQRDILKAWKSTPRPASTS